MPAELAVIGPLVCYIVPGFISNRAWLMVEVEVHCVLSFSIKLCTLEKVLRTLRLMLARGLAATACWLPLRLQLGG